MCKKSTLFLESTINENINNFWLEKQISLIIVSHILPDKLDFISVLSKFFKIEFIIPKPKSIDKKILEKIKNDFEIFNITRDEIYNNQEVIIKKIHKINNKIIIIDIGWYFAKVL